MSEMKRMWYDEWYEQFLPPIRAPRWKDYNEQRDSRDIAEYNNKDWYLSAGGNNDSEELDDYCDCSTEDQGLDFFDFYDITDELQEVLFSKHSDYGPENISKSPGGPINGLTVRLYDKVARLSNLSKTGKKPNNESIRDTFVDIANYAIIGLLVLDGKWNKGE